jgi:hypothetical protein
MPDGHHDPDLSVKIAADSGGESNPSMEAGSANERELLFQEFL